MPMEVANGRVTLNKHGSDVPVTGITPAEAIVLHTLHGPMNGGRTFGDDFNKITIVGVAKVDTGKTEKKQVSPAVPAKTHEEVVTPASPAQGEPGKPGYVAATMLVTKKVIDEPAKEAVFADVPILADRTPVQELQRLRVKYGQAKNNKGELIIDKIWSDRLNPTMPDSFAKINWAEVGGLAASPELQAVGINYVTGALPVTGS